MNTIVPATGCAVKSAATAKPRTVSVNGIAITREAIAQETQNHPASKPIEAWRAAARALVIRELLLQEARRLCLAPAPLTDEEGRRETEEEALIRQLVEREVVTPEPDDVVCRRYYDQNAQRFATPDLHEVSHILVPIGVTAESVSDAQRKVDALMSILRDDPSAFGALARDHSACPSCKVEGCLGQIGPGQTVPEFEAALRRVPVGSIAPEPVPTRYGLHIVRVDRRVEGRQLPFELVRERIAAFLQDRIRAVAERQYVQLLAGRARIEGVDLEAAVTPLLQ